MSINYPAGFDVLVHPGEVIDSLWDLYGGRVSKSSIFYFRNQHNSNFVAFVCEKDNPTEFVRLSNDDLETIFGNVSAHTADDLKHMRRTLYDDQREFNGKQFCQRPGFPTDYLDMVAKHLAGDDTPGATEMMLVEELHRQNTQPKKKRTRQSAKNATESRKVKDFWEENYQPGDDEDSESDDDDDYVEEEDKEWIELTTGANRRKSTRSSARNKPRSPPPQKKKKRKRRRIHTREKKFPTLGDNRQLFHTNKGSTNTNKTCQKLLAIAKDTREKCRQENIEIWEQKLGDLHASIPTDRSLRKIPYGLMAQTKPTYSFLLAIFLLSPCTVE